MTRASLLVLAALVAFPTLAAAEHEIAHRVLRPATVAPVAEASGEGIVTVVPDQAVLTLGVRTEGPTAREAMDANTRLMTAVLQALATAGFSGPNVSTQSITVGPRYEYKPNEAPRVVGYEATNQIRVTAAPTAVGQAIDVAVQAGANVSGGLAFGLKDPRPRELEAIGRAVQDAQERLNAMVAALGKKVTRVIEVRIVESGPPTPIVERFAVARAAAGPPPVEPGQISVRARVVIRAQFQ